MTETKDILPTNIAPVVMFAYNRLYHARKTLEALANNTLAKHTKLYIYLDAAPNEEAKVAVQEVRNYFHNYKKHNKKSFSEITIIERKKNYGLTRNIIGGITDILDRFNRVIVFEDDLISGPYTLEYFNRTLDMYEDKEDVWHITAWNYPANFNTNKDVYFQPYMYCWGWATWKDRWNKFDKKLNPKAIFSDYTEQNIYKFNKDGKDDLQWSIVQYVMNDPYKTWDIYWYGTIFNSNGLCACPKESLIRNIGNDYSGTNCNTYLGLSTQKISEKSIRNFPDEIKEDKNLTQQLHRYLAKEHYDLISMKKIIAENEQCNEYILYHGFVPNMEKLRRKEQIKNIMKRYLLKYSRLYYNVDIAKRKALENETKILQLQNKNDVLLLRFEIEKEVYGLKKYMGGIHDLFFFEIMGASEIINILQIIAQKKPKKILEIGSGISSILFAREVSQYGGTYISIDNHKKRGDKVNYILQQMKLYPNNKVYGTQIIYSKVENMQHITYDYSVLEDEHGSFDMIILNDEIETIQKHSVYAIPILLEKQIKEGADMLTHRVKEKNNYKSLWEKHPSYKNINVL